MSVTVGADWLPIEFQTSDRVLSDVFQLDNCEKSVDVVVDLREFGIMRVETKDKLSIVLHCVVDLSQEG